MKNKIGKTDYKVTLEIKVGDDMESCLLLR